MGRKSLVVAFLVFVVLALPTVVLADGRVALVGNSTYAHLQPHQHLDGEPVVDPLELPRQPFPSLSLRLGF